MSIRGIDTDRIVCDHCDEEIEGTPLTIRRERDGALRVICLHHIGVKNMVSYGDVETTETTDAEGGG